MSKSFSLLPIALGVFLCLSLVARAQNFVVFPHGDAKWTVDITASSSTSSSPSGAAHNIPAPHPVHVEVTQLGELKRVLISWSDGKTTEKWTIPGLPVTFNQDPRSGMVRSSQNGSLREMLSELSLTYDSFAFTWITPQCLQEKAPISYLGKQCFHYLGTAILPLAGTQIHLKKEAWIDAKTLLPVALNTDDSQSIFTFQDKPPTETLTPPPEFQKEIIYYKATMGYK